jgi:hypothetical protein
MNAAERIAVLENLLARVRKNRRPAPSSLDASSPVDDPSADELPESQAPLSAPARVTAEYYLEDGVANVKSLPLVDSTVSPLPTPQQPNAAPLSLDDAAMPLTSKPSTPALASEEPRSSNPPISSPSTMIGMIPPLPMSDAVPTNPFATRVSPRHDPDPGDDAPMVLTEVASMPPEDELGEDVADGDEGTAIFKSGSPIDDSAGAADVAAVIAEDAQPVEPPPESRTRLSAPPPLPVQAAPLEDSADVDGATTEERLPAEIAVAGEEEVDLDTNPPPPPDSVTARHRVADLSWQPPAVPPAVDEEEVTVDHAPPVAPPAERSSEQAVVVDADEVELFEPEAIHDSLDVNERRSDHPPASAVMPATPRGPLDTLVEPMDSQPEVEDALTAPPHQAPIVTEPRLEDAFEVADYLGDVPSPRAPTFGDVLAASLEL